MFRVICSLMLLGSMAFAATTPPKQNEIMPVLAEIQGVEFPVVAQKDGQYFQVFVAKGSTPYFADKDGVSISLDSGTEFTLFYQAKDGFKAMPKGQSNPNAVKTVVGKNDAGVQLVCWRRGGWGYGGGYGCGGGYYGGCYRPCYYGYSYPYYGGCNYGYGYGYNSCGYDYSYSYYGGGYGYGSGCYGGGCYYPYRYVITGW